MKEYYTGNISEIENKSMILERLKNSGALHYALSVKNVYKNNALSVIQNIEISAIHKNYLIKSMK